MRVLIGKLRYCGRVQTEISELGLSANASAARTGERCTGAKRAARLGGLCLSAAPFPDPGSNESASCRNVPRDA